MVYLFCPNIGTKFREPYQSNHVIPQRAMMWVKTCSVRKQIPSFVGQPPLLGCTWCLACLTGSQSDLPVKTKIDAISMTRVNKEKIKFAIFSRKLTYKCKIHSNFGIFYFFAPASVNVIHRVKVFHAVRAVGAFWRHLFFKLYFLRLHRKHNELKASSQKLG